MNGKLSTLATGAGAEDNAVPLTNKGMPYLAAVSALIILAAAFKKRKKA